LEDKKVLYADIALILVTMIWGIGFVVTKGSLDLFTPFYMMAYRFLLASIGLTIISFKKLKNITKREIKAGMIVGFTMLVGYGFQTVGMKYTSAGTAAFITSSNVVMVPFISWMFTKRRPDKFEMFGALLCFIGISVLSIDENLKVGIGEFFILFCAVGYALQIISIGHYAKDIDPLVLTTVQIYAACIMFFAIAIPTEPPIKTFTFDMLKPLLYLAFASSMLTGILQNVAQKYTTTSHAAIILSMEAVFGSLFGILLLNEPFNIRFILGSIAILFSIIVSETKLEFLKPRERILER